MTNLTENGEILRADIEIMKTLNEHFSNAITQNISVENAWGNSCYLHCNIAV